MMLQLVLLMLMTSHCALSTVLMHQREQHQQEMDEVWMNFKKTHNKIYHSEEEDTYRRSVWQDNVDYIQKHNLEADLGLHTFTLGVNEYADLTLDEYKQHLLTTIFPANETVTETVNEENIEPFPDDNLPTNVDWRKRGYVTPVKNQGTCGSCWAFSATGALEGQNFKKTGRLVSLSEQNLVDCSGRFGNYGCNGGRPDWSFMYVKQNGGIDREDLYRYEGVQRPCRYKSSAIGGRCSGFIPVLPKGNELALQRATADIGPISISMDAGHRSFQLYKAGVYNEPACNTQRLSHAMLVVGYGTSAAGQNYWLVKNSWGLSWGAKGYILMSRNRENQCGIASDAVYPTV